MLVPQGRDAARSSASCAATSPARRGRSTGRRARCTARRCPPGLRESEQLPEPVFTPSTKAAVGDHDENISFDAGRRPRRHGRGRRGRAPSASSSTAGPRRGPPSGGIIIADTKFELGLDRRRAGPLRRGAHPRLVPVLAGRRSGSRAPRRPRSTSSRCATASRPRTGTSARRRRRCRPRSCEATSDALRRGLRAHHRQPLRRLARRRRGRRDGACAFPVLVEVRLRPGIADPAGRHHRAGAARARLRRRRRTCGSARPSASPSRPPTRPRARPQVDELCQRFLTNPVIEDADVA